jgi:uncharacterized RDD family membrane protein YckC
MANDIQFETPENVRLSYRPAGPGTRFIAWFIDNILIGIVAFVAFIAMLIAGASVDIVGHGLYGHSNHALLYFLGIFWLAYSVGSLLYFGCCELLLRGQTIGKRQVHIRVVKTDGFSLDPLSIFIRTMFRIVDHIPILFIVPVMTAKGQRFGDLVAGTVVIAEEQATIGDLRDQLAAERSVDGHFRFDIKALKRARPQDVQAVEKILERWSKLSEIDQQLLLERMVPPLASRLQVETPPATDWPAFLRDFLAAEYRRQHRNLG